MAQNHSGPLTVASRRSRHARDVAQELRLLGEDGGGNFEASTNSPALALPWSSRGAVPAVLALDCG